MRKIIAMQIALFALFGCTGNKSPAATEQANADKCKTIAASEQWFKDLMKTAAKNISPATEGDKCPCYETITCEGEKYCSAHKCIDGSIHNPWEAKRD